MKLKDALEDSLYSERFYNIIESNLYHKKVEPFTDGSIILEITSVGKVCLEHIGSDIYPYYEKEDNKNAKPVIEVRYNIDIVFEILGLNLNFDIYKFDGDGYSLYIWLTNDNYVCVALSGEVYKIMESSEFIKSLKNPVKLIKR
jgi:hypothetical protein